MRMFVGSELAEKAEADQFALKAGATVFHARTSPTAPSAPPAASCPWRNSACLLLATPHLSRTTLTSLLLDEAETGRHGNGIVVPLT